MGHIRVRDQPSPYRLGVPKGSPSGEARSARGSWLNPVRWTLIYATAALGLTGCFLSIHELESVSGDGLGAGNSGGESSGGSSAAGGNLGPQGGAPTSEGGGGGVPSVIPMDDLLDDFEDGDTILLDIADRYGEWSSDNGGTGVTSVKGPILPTIFDPPRGKQKHALFISGSGYSEEATFGASFGVDLQDPGLQHKPALHDLSDYAGILIWAKGSGKLSVQVRTAKTTPVIDGGSCNIETEECYGHYQTTFDLSSRWGPIPIRFDQLKQPDWATQVPLELTEALTIHFQNEPKTSAFEVWIDEIGMY